jgi:hypothetical protein
MLYFTIKIQIAKQQEKFSWEVLGPDIDEFDDWELEYTGFESNFEDDDEFEGKVVGSKIFGKLYNLT